MVYHHGIAPPAAAGPASMVHIVDAVRQCGGKLPNCKQLLNQQKGNQTKHKPYLVRYGVNCIL